MMIMMMVVIIVINSIIITGIVIMPFQVNTLYCPKLYIPIVLFCSAIFLPSQYLLVFSSAYPPPPPTPQVTCYLTSTTPAGLYLVTVVAPGPFGRPVNGDEMSVTTDPTVLLELAPTVTTSGPLVGSLAGQTLLTLTSPGSPGFNGSVLTANSILLGGAFPCAVTSATALQLTCLTSPFQGVLAQYW